MAPAAVESMFAEIELLVLEGDAAGLAARVSELSAERRREREDAENDGGPQAEAAPAATAGAPPRGSSRR